MKSIHCPPSTVLLLFAASLLAATPSALAQPETDLSPPFTERIDVQLIDVDVWVEDDAHRPVTGLTVDDFQLLHDGRPVSPTHFAEIRGGRPAGDGISAPTVPGHLVLYFDQTRLGPGSYEPLIEALAELLDDPTVDPERVLVLRQAGGLAAEVPFGSSRSEIDEGLRRIAASPVPGADPDGEIRVALDAIRRNWEQSQDIEGAGAGSLGTGAPGGGGGGSPRAVVGGFGDAAGPDACGPFVAQIEPVLHSWSRTMSQRIERTLESLESTTRFLSALPGVTSLLYLSDGLEIAPDTALASYASGLCPSAGPDLLGNSSARGMSSRFLALARQANGNRVTIHAVQANAISGSPLDDATNRRQPRARGGFDTSRRTSAREGLSLLARETGGRTIFGTQQLPARLAGLGRDATAYYSLAYPPPSSHGGVGDEYRVEVRLTPDAGELRYRRSFRQQSADEILRQRVEGVLNLGITSNPLAIRLGAGEPADGEEGRYRVPLHVMVPVENLTLTPDADGGSAADLRLLVLVRGLESPTAGAYDREFRVRAEPGSTGSADLAIELDLASGVHVTGVGLLDVASGRTSSVATTLQLGTGN